MQTLAATMKKQNAAKKPMTDAQLNALKRSLLRINYTFENVADFMGEKSKQEAILKSFPIQVKQVFDWKKRLGVAADKDIKQYLDETKA